MLILHRLGWGSSKAVAPREAARIEQIQMLGKAEKQAVRMKFFTRGMRIRPAP